MIVQCCSKGMTCLKGFKVFLGRVYQMFMEENGVDDMR